MDSKQKMTANESPQTLWSLLSDDADVSLPYNGSSGWSGTDTSRERAVTADTNGATRSTQNQILGHIFLERENGMTWKELADITGWHHGTVSGALSVLHKTNRIARLKEKRNKCRVYVTPEYVEGRETDEQGRKHQCPECGHKF
jgi:DNA-directed RNA polymerase subunit RPC12/RpoP